MKWGLTLSTITVATMPFFSHAKIRYEKNLKNVYRSTTLGATGYGASLKGARRESIAKCRSNVGRWESKCENDSGEFIKKENCHETSNKYSFKTYESQSTAKLSCRVGKRISSWRGFTHTRDSNDFYALDLCEKELTEIRDKCIEEGGVLGNFREECEIVNCVSTECIASASEWCGFSEF